MFRSPMRQQSKHKAAKGLIFLLAMACFALAMGGIVMLLWNAIIPAVTDWSVLSFWQAFGLLVLCRILFGGFGWYRNRSKWSKHGPSRWRSKWSNMSPEEREAFRAKWRERCGRS